MSPSVSAMPFPFRLIPGLRKLVGPIGTFGEGKVPFNFQVRKAEEGRDDFAVGTLICYEDIFPSLFRKRCGRKPISFSFARMTRGLGVKGAEQHAARLGLACGGEPPTCFAAAMQDGPVGLIKGAIKGGF